MTTIDLPRPILAPSPTATVTPAPPPIAPAASPLTPEHLAQLALAKTREKKLRRARKVASGDAWCTAIFAGAALLSGIFSLAGLAIGLALAIVAFNSFRGLRLLKNLDPRAPRFLGYNQLFLAGSIILYSLYCIYDAAHGKSAYSAYLADPQLAGLLGPIDHIAWILTLTVYLAVIGGTLVAQGLTALFYFTRAKHLRAYRESTPQWIIDFQRANQP